MKKIIVVGLAIFAVSTSAALAKGKAKKPAAAPAAAASTVSPLMAPVSAADMALYKKSQVESGMKKK